MFIPPHALFFLLFIFSFCKLSAIVTSHSSLFGQVPVLFGDRSHLEQRSNPYVKPVLQHSLYEENKYTVVQNALDAILSSALEPESSDGKAGV